MPGYRARLLALWISQFAAIAADNCLRQYVIARMVRDAGWDAAAHLVTILFLLPYILLGPINGALSNSLPKRTVLVASAAFRLAATAVVGVWVLGWLPPYGLMALPWLVAVGAAAIGAAAYSPARYGLLPAIAIDARIPLSRVNGFIEMGILCAMLGGMILGGVLTEWGIYILPVVLGLYALAATTALPAIFPSDVRRPEPLRRATVSFFTDARRIVAQKSLRNTLLGLACFWGLATAITNSLYDYLINALDYSPRQATDLLAALGAGVAAGSLLAGVVRHPRRVLGWVPFGFIALVVMTIWLAGTDAPWLPAILLGLAGGLVDVPLNSTYQASLPEDARGNGMAIGNTFNYLAMALFSGIMAAIGIRGLLSPSQQLIMLAAIGLIVALVAWRKLFREVLELVTSLLFLPFYRIRAIGPGAECFPVRGPAIVVANHSSWLDPFFLGKVIPRTITPMMGSGFYDLPVIRWLVRRVVRAIRVAESTYRYEVPELGEAVRRLDRDEVLVIFPEGRLRRKDDQLLRNFGQGVWRILRDRPQTPVVCCWIEGAWGSYTSHYNGPPGRGKPFDWLRKITIVMGKPEVLSPELLAHHRAARRILMETVLSLRQYLPVAAGFTPAAEPHP